MTDDQKPQQQITQNASQIDAYFDGMRQAAIGAERIVPNHFTKAAATEWRRGYDERKRAGEKEDHYGQ